MATTEAAAPESLNGKKTETLETVVVRFCGDSGDGMQLAGTQFTNASAVFGNDVSTLPDFPAEVAPLPARLRALAAFSSASRHTTFIHLAIPSTRSSP